METAVVIVDNDESQLKTLGKYLDVMGISYATANNGYAGVSLIKKTQPKIALIDISMPGLSGIDVAKQIRVKGQRFPKVILVSGYPELIREANLADLNVFTVIDKPIPLRVLGSFIQKVLSLR